MTKFGCARVSTTDQELDAQLAKLEAEGCETVRAEKQSGASREGREQLNTIIEFLRESDEAPTPNINMRP